MLQKAHIPCRKRISFDCPLKVGIMNSLQKSDRRVKLNITEHPIISHYVRHVYRPYGRGGAVAHVRKNATGLAICTFIFNLDLARAGDTKTFTVWEDKQ